MRKLLMVAIGVVCSSSNGQGFASGEEIKVLSAVGMRQVLVELAPMFERATGHRLHLTFDSGAVIVRRIQSGEAADVILVPDDGLRQLAAAGRIAGESMTAVASSRVGVAVHAGAPRPDIASAAALRQTLLAARSVARPDPALGGSSGLHIQKTFERLGIADALAAKSILSSHPDREDEMPAARVARGEAEIALHQIQELLAVPGVVVIGPLPGELDGQFLFSAALVRGTGRTDAGRKLIAFLVTPRAREVIKRKGMQAASTETGGEPRLEQPFGSFATDWDEIDTAVEFIRSLRGDRALKVNLVGWVTGWNESHWVCGTSRRQHRQGHRAQSDAVSTVDNRANLSDEHDGRA